MLVVLVGAAGAVAWQHGLLRPPTAQDLYERAMSHLASGRPDLAAGELRQTLALDPARSDARWQLVQSYIAVGNGAAAVTEIGRLDPREFGPELNDRLLYALVLAGRLDEVLERTAHLDATSSAEAWRLRGWTLLHGGRLAEAQAHYEAFVRAFPGDPDAELGLARVSLGRDQYGDASERLTALLQAHPRLADGWLAFGHVLTVLGQYATAAQAFTRAAALGANDVEARIGLARALLAERKLDDARPIVADLRSGHPDDADVSFLAGQAAELAGDPRSAATRYQETLVHRPDDYAALLGLGTVQAQSRLVATAESGLQHARALFPDRPEASVLLALVYRQNGKPTKSVDVLTDLLGRVRTPQGFYRLCSGGPRLLSFDDLDELLGAWLAVHGDDAAALLTLALEADAAGRAAAARKYYARVLMLEPGNAIARELTAMPSSQTVAAAAIGGAGSPRQSVDEAGQTGARFFGCALQ